MIKNKYKLAIASVILFGAIVRLYLFKLVKNQAHWWDSLAYGSLAKNMIFHKWDSLPFLIHESTIRPPLLPIIWSLFLRIGASDYFLILFTNIIPSITSIFLIYLIGKEMYGKKIGLVAAAFTSVSWIHLFYSARAMTDIPSMCLVLASIYFFIKSHDSLSIKPWFLSVLFLSLAVLFRYSHAVIAAVYISFLIFVHNKNLIFNKKFWIGGVIGSIPLILFMLINLFNYGSILPATSEYSSSACEKTEFAWYTLGFLKDILISPTIFLFILGILLVISNLVISYGFISKNKESKMHLFNLLLLIFIFSFFIFIIKASEDRYLLSLSSVFFTLSAFTIRFIYRLISKYRKEVALVVCIALIIWSMYSQLFFAKNLMLNKKDTFKQMKEAYEWINLNTHQDTIITGDWAEPYTIYYAEREFQTLPQDLNFSNFTLKADYVILTAIHQPNEKVVGYVNDLVEKSALVPTKAFFFDAEEKQPAVIIYKKA